MRKSILVPLGLSLILLSGCINNGIKITYNISDTVQEVETELQSYNWGSADYIKMVNTLDSYTFVSFIQEVKLYNSEGFYNYINYNVEADLKREEVYITKCSGNNVEDDFSRRSYKYDWNKFYVEDYGEWKECELETQEILEVFKNSKTVKDLLIKLINLHDIDTNLVGKLQDNNSSVVVLEKSNNASCFTNYGIDISSNLPIYCLEENDMFSTYILIESIK